MRPYETLIVLNPGLGEEIAKQTSSFESIIREQGGSVDATRDWGVRDLAYPIHKNRQGRYFLLEYQAEPEAVKELERKLRINEGVLRFVSVQQEHTGLPEPRVVRDYGDRRDVPLHEMHATPYEDRARAAAPEAEAAPDLDNGAEAAAQEQGE